MDSSVISEVDTYVDTDDIEAIFFYANNRRRKNDMKIIQADRDRLIVVWESEDYLHLAEDHRAPRARYFYGVDL